MTRSTGWKCLAVFAVLLILSSIPATGDADASPFVTDLVAGRDLDIGDVLVWNDASYLYIEIGTVENWCLTGTKVHIGTSLAALPQTRNGNPKPGQFDYKASHSCIDDTTYQIPLTWDVGEDLYIAVKAGAQGTIGSRFERSVVLLEGAWGAGTDFPGPSPATYFVYTVEEYIAIGWANLQWPPSMMITLPDISEPAYGQVWIDGVTGLPGPTPGLRAQVGFGPDGTNPDGNADWTWVEAAFNVDVGNNDEFIAGMAPTETGDYDYLYRYSLDDGLTWTYADLDGMVPTGDMPPNPGAMTVQDSAIDTFAILYVTVPGYTPADSVVYLAGSLSQLGYGQPDWDPAGVALTKVSDYLWTITLNGALGTIVEYKFTLGSWGSLEKDESCGHIINRSVTLQGQTVNDTVVNWADHGPCRELDPMDLTFSVTVPPGTPADSTVYIAGDFSSFDATLPVWDPAGIALTNVGGSEWSVTLHGLSSVYIEYKYTLGSWTHLEKNAACDEINNRSISTLWGTDGTQLREDTVLNWGNIVPCGD